MTNLLQPVGVVRIHPIVSAKPLHGCVHAHFISSEHNDFCTAILEIDQRCQTDESNPAHQADVLISHMVISDG